MIYEVKRIAHLIGSAAEEVAEEAVTMLNDRQYATIDEAVDGEADRWLMWTANQWEIMQEYQDPQDANFYEAVSEFYSDIYALIDEQEEEDEEGIILEDEDGGKYIIDVVITYQDAEEKSGAVWYKGDRLSSEITIMSGSSFASYLDDEAGEVEKIEIIDEIKAIEEERQKQCISFFIIDAYKSLQIDDIKSTLKEHAEITAEDVKAAAEAAEALDEPAIEDLVMIIEEIQEEGGSSIC